MSKRSRRKKRRSASRRRHHARELQGLLDSELEQQLRSAVESGDGRRAVEISKEVQKRGLLLPCLVLVESAYRRRAEQLLGQRLFPEAEIVVRNALDLGVESPGLREALLRSRLATGRTGLGHPGLLGRMARDLSSDPEEGLSPARLEEHLLADMAVLALDGAPDELSEPLRSEVGAVRTAFSAYEKGDEAGMQTALRAIPRRSACSPWRLLLRGLAAAESGDAETASRAWSQVPPATLCGRVAAAFLDLDSAAPGDGAGGARVDAAADRPLRLTRRDLESPLIEGLRGLEKFLERQGGEDEEDPDEPLDRCARFLRTHGRELSDDLRRRIGEQVLTRLALDSGDFGACVELFGLPREVSHVVRGQALAHEKSLPGQAAILWERLLRFLEELRGITPRARKMARGMVWARIGDLLDRAGDASPNRWCPCPNCRRARRARSERDAPTCYEKALELDPENQDVASKRVEALLARGRMKEAERAMAELVERWPEHVPTLLKLGNLLLDRNALRKALKLFDRARALEPLNAAVIESVQRCYLLSARRRLAGGNLSLARKDLEAAGELSLQGPRPEVFLFRAALECLDGDIAGGEGFYRRTIEKGLPEELGAFRMVHELRRAGVAPATRRPFDDRLRRILAAKPQPEMLREAARFFASRGSDGEPRGPMEEYLSPFVDYLRRAQDLDLDVETLLAACDLLYEEERWKLLRKFSRKGSKAFPERVKFAALEMVALVALGKKIPVSLGRRTEEALKKALRDGDPGTFHEVASVLAAAGLDPSGDLDPVIVPRADLDPDLDVDLDGAGDDLDAVKIEQGFFDFVAALFDEEDGETPGK